MIPRQTVRIPVAIDTSREVGPDVGFDGVSPFAPGAAEVQGPVSAGEAPGLHGRLSWGERRGDHDPADGVEFGVHGVDTSGSFG